MNATMEELKFIGFSGIFSQSFKTIFTWKKLFIQITLTLILPLSFIFIAHMTISHRFFNQIEKNPYQLFSCAFDNYKSYYDTSADLRNYFLFKLITISTVTVFSVLSTSAVVYVIASVYTGRDVTFRQSMKYVPKVWKRVTVTFICMLLTLIAYTLIASVLIFVLSVVIGIPVPGNLVWLASSIVYIFGFLYLITVWQVAAVVSVLESSSGVKAMIKSSDLLAGKRKPALTTSIMLYQFLTGVVIVYMLFVAYDGAALAMVWRVVIGIMCGVLTVIVFLLIMVTETVVYLVCKSYHREPVEPVSISTYLSAYLTDSRPVFRTAEDIQLGRPHNQPVSQV
ncbi:hypothetical protein R6Q57_022477 [Mikania cordata]